MKKGHALNLSKGFTLIELLVVISIIGILAALTLTGFAAARKNARDAARKSDLGQYRVALEAYSSSSGGIYPYGSVVCSTSCTGDSDTPSGIFADSGPIITEYLPTLIGDTNTDTNFTYRYYQSADGLTYKLTSLLETGGYWVICSSGKAGKKTTTSADAVCDLP